MCCGLNYLGIGIPKVTVIIFINIHFEKICDHNNIHTKIIESLLDLKIAKNRIHKTNEHLLTLLYSHPNTYHLKQMKTLNKQRLIPLD